MSKSTGPLPLAALCRPWTVRREQPAPSNRLASRTVSCTDGCTEAGGLPFKAFDSITMAGMIQRNHRNTVLMSMMSSKSLDPGAPRLDAAPALTGEFASCRRPAQAGQRPELAHSCKRLGSLTRSQSRRLHSLAVDV